jgi:hypothetical protein
MEVLLRNGLIKVRRMEMLFTHCPESSVRRRFRSHMVNSSTSSFSDVISVLSNT